MVILRRLRDKSILSLILVNGCGEPQLPSTMHVAAASQLPVAPDAATVVFMRPKDGAEGGDSDNTARDITVVDDQSHLYGTLVANMYFATTVPPGRHTFVSFASQTTSSALSADLAAGRTYYVLVIARAGAFREISDMVAIGRMSPLRNRVPAFLTATRHAEPDPALLQALEGVEKRKYVKRIRDGVQALAQYKPDVLAKHVLRPDDGELEASGPAPAACPNGQLANADTAGHCCWPAQAWAPSRNTCVGTPQCPRGFALAGETCTQPACPDGQSISPDTAGHCCWPGQAWAVSRGACVGVPACPPALHATQDACVRE